MSAKYASSALYRIVNAWWRAVDRLASRWIDPYLE